MKHLLNEGIRKEKNHFVGNTIIDTLVVFQNYINASDILKKNQLKKQEYILMTMYRPATVDTIDGLEN